MDAIFGSEPDEPAAPEVDYGSLWGNYSRWVGEAQERYEADVDEISRMPGLGGPARQQALDARFKEYETELGALRGGPTYSMLQQHYTDSGGANAGAIARKAYETGELDPTAGRDPFTEWMTSRYGGYTPSGVSGKPGQRIEAGPAPRPGASATGEASMAGLGDTRPWWAKA